MAESKRKFYRNTFLIEVLSKDPISSCPSLETIRYQMNDGDWVGEVTHLKENRVVRARKMVALLDDMGSDSEFFCLTPEGEDMEGLHGDDEKRLV